MDDDCQKHLINFVVSIKASLGLLCHAKILDITQYLKISILCVTPQAGGREGSRDYGAETAIFISTLIVLYLLAVVFLVRRQINQVGAFWLVDCL